LVSAGGGTLLDIVNLISLRSTGSGWNQLVWAGRHPLTPPSGGGGMPKTNTVRLSTGKIGFVSHIFFDAFENKAFSTPEKRFRNDLPAIRPFRP
jgi:hypothetical protein